MRPKRVWPSGHLRRRWVWLNRMDRIQVLFFKTMKEWPWRWLRNFRAAPPTSGPESSAPRGMTTSAYFKGQGSPRESQVWPPPPQSTLGPCPWYGSLAIDNIVGSTPRAKVMVLPLWQGQKAEDHAKGDSSQVLIINVVCLIYWVLDLLGNHYPFLLPQVFLLGWIFIPYTCSSVVWKLVTFLLPRFTAGE